MSESSRTKSVPPDVRYPSAFIAGYRYAYGNDEWGFGEHSDEEDLKHIPKNIKHKDLWVRDWHFGCGVGVQ